MAAKKVSSVTGGNWQIFEKFLKRSKATVYLNTKVTKLVQTGERGWRLHASGSGPKHKTYDAVILAAPHGSSNIQFESAMIPSLASLPVVEYVNLHVTLLATKSPTPQASFFDLDSNTKIPTTVLTTGTIPAEERFNSISYHTTINRPGQPKEWIVKIFSKEELSDAWLDAAFGPENVGWVHRKLVRISI
jgi:prenylcysteine oxidase/farnesylcysteine lyase